jgi:hypothetical protein
MKLILTTFEQLSGLKNKLPQKWNLLFWENKRSWEFLLIAIWLRDWEFTLLLSWIINEYQETK